MRQENPLPGQFSAWVREIKDHQEQLLHRCVSFTEAVEYFRGHLAVVVRRAKRPVPWEIVMAYIRASVWKQGSPAAVRSPRVTRLLIPDDTQHSDLPAMIHGRSLP